MKYLLFIILLVTGCSLEPMEQVKEINTITTITEQEQETIYCSIELYRGDCWNENNETWRTIDLSDYFIGKRLIEVEVTHTGGDIIHSIKCFIRASQNEAEYSFHADYNESNTVLFNSSNNNSLQWKHEWAADDYMKINITIRLKMY